MARQPSRVRVLVRVALLLILAAVAVQYLRVRAAERRVPDWKFHESVSVVLLVPKAASVEDRRVLDEIRAFALVGSNRATFWALKDWFDREFARYVDRPGFSPVLFDVVGPRELEARPPPPPRAGESLSSIERWKRTRAFLAAFEPLRPARRDASVVYVYFYTPDEAPHFKTIHSVAERRSRSGFIFAPLNLYGVETALVHTAHETLHLFGATDKYEDETCTWPEGFYEPFLTPRFPQRYAEVMAMGIPTSAGSKEESLQFFEHMRVGVATAAEIGWIDEARRERYYGGDVTAGGKGD